MKEPLGPLDPPRREHVLGQFLADLGRRPVVLAGFLLALGFVAVFVRQLPLVQQILFGAPLFEECLKFGLALLTIYWLPVRWLRVVWAGIVGGAFGWLEHVVSYPGESDVAWGFRIAFHAGAVALSMASFHALVVSRDVRSRPLAVLPAVLLHFYNNAMAVFLALVSLFADRWIDVAAFMLQVAVLTVMAAFFVILTGRPALWRRGVENRLHRWFGPAPPGGHPPWPRA